MSDELGVFDGIVSKKIDFTRLDFGGLFINRYKRGAKPAKKFWICWWETILLTKINLPESKTDIYTG